MNSPIETNSKNMIAYFSMEIGINPKMPTYSGGLGVLAGDTIQSAADLRQPMVCVSLLYSQGYFKQEVRNGEQSELPVKWFPEEFCTKLNEQVTIKLSGRDVKVQAYKYDVKGVDGHIVPIFFLDTDIDGNSEFDRSLTSNLYGGDETYRLSQEIVLGMGGVALLSKLGFKAKGLKSNMETDSTIRTYHMNEGHAALLTMELLSERIKSEDKSNWDAEDIEWVKSRSIFTTHTPVPAGHDCFNLELCQSILGENFTNWAKELNCFDDRGMNLSLVAMNLSRYTNGVSKRHGEVSKELLKNDKIVGITNGVHASRWTSDAFQELYDQEIPEWRKDNFYLRNVIDMDNAKIAAAHKKAKIALFEKVKERTTYQLDPEVLTIGFARRATEYKRSTLLFRDIERLKSLADKAGKIQLIFAGKAHPKDQGGKSLIKSLNEFAAQLSGSNVMMVFVENYDMELGRLICSGVDVWLNNPLKPLEASGTSGMKSALNGVPSLSTLDGWWIEGCIENVTGWEIEDSAYATDTQASIPQAELDTANQLYKKLEEVILPMYYNNNSKWQDIMRYSISMNGSYFNTHRMMLQYIENAYC